MEEELKEKLYKILKELPDESYWLDYKEIPYKEDKYKRASFIKDICGFLNSTEGYGKDKFIIFGISDKTKEKKGIENVPMEDDEKYQTWCEYIEPRPTIETGTIEFEGDKYGYIFITKNNNERVYSISKDYPDEYVMRQEIISKVKEKVYASVAYIRKGSKNYTLSEGDRRKIYEYDREMKTREEKELIFYATPKIDEEFKDVLKICALFGMWHENKESEKQIISGILNKEYDDWIKVIKKLLSQKSEYVSFKNNCWKIEKKEELIEKMCEEYFGDDILKFKDASIEMLKEENPKFELEADKRIMSSFYNADTKYSKEIKRSTLETFAFIKSIVYKFSNCIDEIKNISLTIVREVLNNPTWKLIASLEELLPLFAEINGKEYLKQLTCILENKEEMEKLFTEKETFVTQIGYTSGVFWSLQVLAWNQEYIMDVFEKLCKIAEYDKNAIDEMSRILLPWYPQTKVDSSFRFYVMKMILQEYTDVAWKVLMNLMPNVKRHSSATYKPKWNGTFESLENEVTMQELYSQYEGYVKLAIEYSKNDVNRVIDLIGIFENVPRNLFDMIYEKISSDEIINLSDDEKYLIWNEIEDLILKHNRFSDSEWAMSKEIIDVLRTLSEKIKPVTAETVYQRWFRGDYWNLVDSKSKSHTESEKEIFEIQKDIINKLLIKGIENVVKFSSKVKDSYRVGECLAYFHLNDKEEIIIKLLDDSKYEISQGYFKSKFILEGYSWIEQLDYEKLSILGRVRGLIQLPNENKTWEIVKLWLKENECEYWKTKEIRCVEDGSDYNYAINKLIENKRPIVAVQLVTMALFQKREFSKEYAALALKESLAFPNDINYIDGYHIKEIILDLQKNNYEEDELFQLEWSYLQLLSTDDEYRPITIEKRLSKEPNIFIDLICMAFRPETEDEKIQDVDGRVAMNAYRLLEVWKMVPATLENGKIDGEKLIEWFVTMKDLATQKNRLAVALNCFGHVLFYAKSDEDGFWIDRSVAQLLNQEDSEEIRRGYSVEAFNSLGVVNVDEEGSAWRKEEEKWRTRVTETEKEYFRFANALRGIAENFHEQAEYQKKHYYD